MHGFLVHHLLQELVVIGHVAGTSRLEEIQHIGGRDLHIQNVAALQFKAGGIRGILATQLLVSSGTQALIIVELGSAAMDFAFLKFGEAHGVLEAFQEERRQPLGRTGLSFRTESAVLANLIQAVSQACARRFQRIMPCFPVRVQIFLQRVYFVIVPLHCISSPGPFRVHGIDGLSELVHVCFQRWQLLETRNASM